ncbi:MAG: PilZ domain-containing protein [Ahrensia sp.]|nr:PilZ domain-containing protein [Ahrensia sp.]
MSLATATTQIDFSRRQFQRVAVNLHGRYMLENRQEFDCTVSDMSPGSARFKCTTVGQVGERIVAYIDHVGRIEGEITRLTTDGFGVELISSPRKQEKLAAQLTWLANKHELALPEDRRHERVVPQKQMSMISLPDGRQYRCRIIDLSLSGAAIEIKVRPSLGTKVNLGNMRGTVVRHFDDGVAIEFAVIQRRESLSDFLN